MNLSPEEEWELRLESLPQRDEFAIIIRGIFLTIFFIGFVAILVAMVNEPTSPDIDIWEVMAKSFKDTCGFVLDRTVEEWDKLLKWIGL